MVCICMCFLLTHVFVLTLVLVVMLLCPYPGVVVMLLLCVDHCSLDCSAGCCWCYCDDAHTDHEGNETEAACYDL